jgi:hypothetical protein
VRIDGFPKTRRSQAFSDRRLSSACARTIVRSDVTVGKPASNAVSWVGQAQMPLEMSDLSLSFDLAHGFTCEAISRP